MDHQRIVVRNALTEIERVSRMVEAFGATHGLAHKAIFQLNLALDEILTNVISYAFTDGAGHDIVLRLAVIAGQITAEVEDDGQAFNPLDVAPPALDAPLAERPAGGLGLHLVRQVVDRLEYRREGGKNILVLQKTVAAKP
ncbi:MAG: ATP-binding protein [Candidatus Binatia bacterium]